MLGLNGVVVKSHGGTDAEGFAHAVDVAMDMVVHRFNARIAEGLARIAGGGRPPGRGRQRPRPDARQAVGPDRPPHDASRHAGGSTVQHPDLDRSSSLPI